MNQAITAAEALVPASEQTPSYSLSCARPGDLVRVTEVIANKHLKKRLVSMGVLINSRLRVIQRRGSWRLLASMPAALPLVLACHKILWCVRFKLQRVFTG